MHVSENQSLQGHIHIALNSSLYVHRGLPRLNYRTEKDDEIDLSKAAHIDGPKNRYLSCGSKYLPGVDTDTGEVSYYKVVLCGRDWCGYCGQNNSLAHRRRYVRAIDKVAQIEVATMLEITFPPSLRRRIGQKELDMVSGFWRDKLKREVGARGIMRWHWAGEDGKTWKPHLHILAETRYGYLMASLVAKLKKDWARWVFNKLKAKIIPNIHVSYTRNIKKIRHYLRYLLRPTAKVYNSHTATVIKGFRNTRYFGQWDKPKAATNEATEALKGHGIAWQAPIRALEVKQSLEAQNMCLVHIGLGVFRTEALDCGHEPDTNSSSRWDGPLPLEPIPDE